MSRRGLASLLALAALTDCGGSAPPPPVDPALVQTQRLARLAFEQDRPDQAATLYRQAQDRAWRRDDLPAIGDTGYNLAVVELRRGQPAAALDVARRTGDELERRGVPVPADLELVEAVGLYRTGEATAAAQLAAHVAARPDASTETVARALFLTGLVAADEGDTAALTAALAAMGDPTTGTRYTGATEADRDELVGRLALRQADGAAAEAAFVRAADRRRQLLDDRGMARALALAAKACEAQGETATAADFYLRAGRSAALSADTGDAERWLERARQLALQSATPSVAGEAEARLATLRQAANRP